jgi:archaellum biogenesis ATPase FlaH
MPGLRNRPVQSNLIKEILTAMITNTEFLKAIRPVYRSEFFEVSYMQKVSRWVVMHYDEFKEAPGGHIQNIYEEKKAQGLNGSESQIIETFLANLSDQYEQGEFNDQYLLKRARQFFGNRNYEILADKIKQALAQGKPNQLKKVLHSFKEVAIQAAEWTKPFHREQIAKYFENTDEDHLFQYPGDLGELFGPFLRGWLVGFMGPMKRGKSYWLQDMAFQSVINRLRTVVISLEMSTNILLTRFYKYTLNKEQITKEEVMQKSGRFIRNYGDRLRLKDYPAYSASVEDIEADLQELESVENFIPDVIVIDYADILADGSGSSHTERERLDAIWKKLKRMAGQRKCLVVTASQTNRASIEKANITQTDTAEDIRKLAQVDMMIGLNQTEDEKREGIMRMNIVAHRHRLFYVRRQVIVEQDLAVGNPFVSARWQEQETERRGINAHRN